MRRLSARVSDESWQGWNRLCEQHGVTFSAVVEATGRLLLDRRGFADPEQVVDLARRIDFERAKRR